MATSDKTKKLQLLGGGFATKKQLDELSEAIADKANKAGWTPDKYIGTDMVGNLIEKDAPAGGEISDEQIATAVDTWLDEHPEATTTITDNSIDTAKYKDGSVTTAKTDFFVNETEEPEDIVGEFTFENDWTHLSTYLHVENVIFLCVVSTTNELSVKLYDYDGSTYTHIEDAPVIRLSVTQYNTENIYICVLNGYTGYIKMGHARQAVHVYKNALPPLEKPTMLDTTLYNQGLNAHYIAKPYYYLGVKNANGNYHNAPYMVYKADSSEEKVHCYHDRVLESSTASVSIYDENWTLVETITGTKTYDLTVSGGIYYHYVPSDNAVANEETRNFLGKEEDFEMWKINGNRYGWFYTIPDTQVDQIINDRRLEDFVIKHREALLPKFTYVGELWDTNLGKYQAWSFNDLKWDSAKKCMVMLIHDANGHGDGNPTQNYIKEIDPVTFVSTNLPRIRVNGANTASYGFEILDNGNYVVLTAYDGGMRLLTSTDGGNSWTAGDIIQKFTDNGMYAGTYHPFALQKLSNGRLFIALDTSQNEMFYSDDDGATWLTATIPMGDITFTMTEPDLTELDDNGTVMMIARSSEGRQATSSNLAHTIFSISTDYGATWETAQLSEIRANASDATALVHDGIVEVFSCVKYCSVALNKFTDLIEATGYQGDIRRYYATIEEAKQNIWHYAGIMGFAQTTNPAYDLGSPCCCITPDGDIWVGFYDQADDGTSGKMLYRWFVAYKNGSYNFARSIKHISDSMGVYVTDIANLIGGDAIADG